ncbi:MAG: tryptophan 2,3-dioxygenase, partial [Planctomycetota bacterium]
HQTSELWMKLLLHELEAARAMIQADQLDGCFKVLTRGKQILWQLFNQWIVLETLTPSEYAQFRGVLGHASGFQSPQYRALELVLGNKQPEMLRVFAHDTPRHERLTKLLNSPSIYDEFLRSLARKGHAIPQDVIERDWSTNREMDERVIDALLAIYESPEGNWDAYEMSEKLVDLDAQFQLWRFRHMKTVERVIGYKMGTGGTAGVSYLRKVIDKNFFPELLEVRTRIGRS